MIHSLSGGIISDYDKLIYVFVNLEDGLDAGQKRWFISPFPKIAVGDRVSVPAGQGSKLCSGTVERVEVVTKQTAPYPVNRTREVDSILKTN